MKEMHLILLRHFNSRVLLFVPKLPSLHQNQTGVRRCFQEQEEVRTNWDKSDYPASQPNERKHWVLSPLREESGAEVSPSGITSSCKNQLNFMSNGESDQEKAVSELCCSDTWEAKRLWDQKPLQRDEMSNPKFNWEREKAKALTQLCCSSAIKWQKHQHEGGWGAFVPALGVFVLFQLQISNPAVTPGC